MDTPKVTSDDSRTASPSLPISTVLRNAATLLEARGWCQHRFHAQSGEMCVVSAIGLAAGGHVRTLDVLNVFARRIGSHAERLTVWNDAAGRTRSEVLAVLRQAAALAESEGR